MNAERREPPMNVERMSQLANLLDGMVHDDGLATPKETPRRFHLNYYIERSECGTRCCIAGLTALTFAPMETAVLPQNCEGDPTAESVRTLAARLLGLTENEARDLFVPRASFIGTYTDYKNVTPQQAAAVVRRAIREYARTGTFGVNVWRVAL